jgi:hypothetical protein
MTPTRAKMEEVRDRLRSQASEGMSQVNDLCDAVADLLDALLEQEPTLGKYETETLPALLRALAKDSKDAITINALSHSADILESLIAPTVREENELQR